MKILRLLWLDIQKLCSIRLMYAFIAVPALLGFNGWFTSIAFLIFAYLAPYGMFSYDDTSIAENFYGVLPVRREQIVVARYIFALLTMLLMAALMLLANLAFALIFRWQPFAPFFLSALLLGFVCGILLLCAAMPLTMHLGAQKANTNVLIVFVLVFLTMSFSGDNLRPEVLASAPGLLMFCLLALVFSCQICLRLYRKREFYDYVPMKEVRRAKTK